MPLRFESGQCASSKSNGTPIRPCGLPSGPSRRKSGAPETLRLWVQQAERDAGSRAGITADERERLKALERENRELKRANEILRKASVFFAAAGCPLRGLDRFTK